MVFGKANLQRREGALGPFHQRLLDVVEAYLDERLRGEAAPIRTRTSACGVPHSTLCCRACDSAWARS
jgi:hypothetical protein